MLQIVKLKSKAFKKQTELFKSWFLLSGLVMRRWGVASLFAFVSEFIDLSFPSRVQNNRQSWLTEGADLSNWNIATIKKNDQLILRIKDSRVITSAYIAFYTIFP